MKESCFVHSIITNDLQLVLVEDCVL